MVGKIYFHPDDLFFRMCCFFRDGSLVGVVLVLISVGLLGGLFAVVFKELRKSFLSFYIFITLYGCLIAGYNAGSQRFLGSLFYDFGFIIL